MGCSELMGFLDQIMEQKSQVLILMDPQTSREENNVKVFTKESKGYSGNKVALGITMTIINDERGGLDGKRRLLITYRCVWSSHLQPNHIPILRIPHELHLPILAMAVSST